MNTKVLHKEEIDEITRKLQDILALFSGKRVLLTGATGMIGTYLIDVFMNANKQLGLNIAVVALARNSSKAKEKLADYLEAGNFELVIQDVTEAFRYKDIGNVDYVIHAASNTHPKEYSTDPVGTIESNILGMHNIYEYIKNNDLCSKVICLSSVEIYGMSGSEKAFSEKDYGFIDCNTLRAGYSESKRLCEAMAQAYYTQYGIDSVIVRLSRVYGANMEKDDSKVMSQFFRKAVMKEDIVLKSEGKQLFSYTYISDAAAAIIHIMAKGKNGEAYNVAGSIDNMNLKKIAEYIAEISGVDIKYEIPEQVETAGYSTAVNAVLDTTKIEREIGWHPEYNLKTGIKKAMRILEEV